ncbi:MAG: hypothetical protein ABIB71_02830 [Candidatus Woesearchaeota archaeon]
MVKLRDVMLADVSVIAAGGATKVLYQPEVYDKVTRHMCNASSSLEAAGDMAFYGGIAGLCGLIAYGVMRKGNRFGAALLGSTLGLRIALAMEPFTDAMNYLGIMGPVAENKLTHALDGGPGALLALSGLALVLCGAAKKFIKKE